MDENEKQEFERLRAELIRTSEKIVETQKKLFLAKNIHQLIIVAGMLWALTRISAIPVAASFALIFFGVMYLGSIWLDYKMLQERISYSRSDTDKIISRDEYIVFLITDWATATQAIQDRWAARLSETADEIEALAPFIELSNVAEFKKRYQEILAVEALKKNGKHRDIAYAEVGITHDTFHRFKRIFKGKGLFG